VKNASQHTAKRAVTAVAGMALATAMFGAGTASAAVSTVTCTPSSNTVGTLKTCTVNAGNEARFTVPSRVHSVHLQVIGAWGGNAGSKVGGKPMEINTDFMVGPSEVLYLYAGGAGGDGGTGIFGNPGAGGFNGGAAGGDYGNRGTAGGGGGGASDVRVTFDDPKYRQVVAAGGGGAGVSGNGGNHDTSANGTGGGHSGNGGLLNSPFGGSQSGLFGSAGAGRSSSSNNTNGGGGGGGGYGGGGGGNSGTSAYGGGGGSSFYRYKKWSVPGKTAPSTDATSTSGGGKVVLTYKVA
jgi:hypothetical protein